MILNKSQKKEYLALFITHFILVLFYGFPVIKENILYFFIYFIFSFFIFKYALQIEYKRNFISNIDRKIDYSVVKLISVLSLAILLINIDKIELPNFFLSSYNEKIETKSIIPSYIKSIITLNAFILGLSQKKWDKILSSVILIIIFIASGITSRGGLLLAAMPLYIIWKKYKATKIIAITLIPTFILFSISVLMYRVGSESINITEVLSIESQSDNLIQFTTTGMQPNKENIFIFFLPSIIKGEWIATNHYISEQILGVNRDSLLFYVITLGDFANYFIGYGPYWFFYAIFGLLSSIILTKISVQILPEYRFYIYLQFILIASRAGSESILTIFLHGYILPAAILLIINWIKNIAIKRTW